MTVVDMLRHSFFLCVIVQCQSYQHVYYVSKPGFPCPTHALCNTLDWYCKNTSGWSNIDAIMRFQEGVHSLDGFFMVSNSHNFTLSGLGTVSKSYDGPPQPTTKISCTGRSNSGMYFTHSTGISVHNLHFESCGGLCPPDKKHCVQVTTSLAFVYVQNVNISHVVINNSKGYGLFIYNIYGTNLVANSSFMHTKMYPHIPESGNAKVWFQRNSVHDDSEIDLLLISSWFMYGKNNPSSLAAGGLNLFINSSAPVNITLFNVTAQGNTGTNGNLAVYLVDYTNGDGSSVVISHSRILDGRGQKGGGIRFWSHTSHKARACYSHDNHSILTIIDSVFHNNLVTQTGGALYIAFYNNGTSHTYDGITRRVVIKNCNFTENGGNGAAMEIIQHILSPHRAIPLFYTKIENCKFENNYKPLNIDGPILDFIRVEASISNSTFSGSNTSVITLRNTILNLYDTILFANNSAVIGGALKLCEASLIFCYTGTHIRFFNNSASKGGAIYIQQACTDTTPLCFFQPSLPKGTPIEVFKKLINLTFVNNSAEIAGDAIYGGDLDRCSTNVPFTKPNSNKSDYLLFEHIFKEVFHMQEQKGPSWVSSGPQLVCFCQGSQTNNNRSCKTEMKPIEVYPGEIFIVSMITVGQMYGSTEGMINASLEDEHANHLLVRMNRRETGSECMNMTFALHSNKTSARIKLKPITSDLSTHYNITSVEQNINILKCPLGFSLTTTPPYACVCSQVLSKFLYDYNKYGYSPVNCNVTSRVISIPSNRFWFGCFDRHKQNNTTSCNSLMVTPNCGYYCNQTGDTINVSVAYLDSQCSPNHTGIMCGACKPGYSRILGSIHECRKDCTNTNLLFLIPLHLASGLILIIVIMTLNLTVTEGTLNGLLVYTMVLQTLNSYFQGINNISTIGQICWVFISWINLTFGIRACFYSGMDAYQYNWILFAQGFYFLLLLSLIIFLTKKFIFFTRLFGRNIVKVLATIIFLMYSNIAFAIFLTVRYANVHYSTPNTTLPSKSVWYLDGNVPYLGSKHAPLFVVAILWWIAMWFYVFSLLLIQCLQKQSNIWCLRWIVSLKPFYDAYTGPCRDNYRFWPGFLLLMRTGFYIMDSLAPSYSTALFQMKMLTTAAICVVIMSLACIFPHGVYKRWPLNILEFSFFLNLCITSGILGLSSHLQHRKYAVNTSVSISAFTFLGILVYHFHSRIKDTKIWRKFATRFSVQLHTSRIIKPKQSREIDEFLSSSDERASLMPQPLPPVVKFDKCREPLVEA